MRRKVATAALLIALTTSVPVMASDGIEPTIAATATLAEGVTGSVSTNVGLIPQLKSPELPARRGVISSLYVSLAGLNAYDAYTTVKGVGAGSREANGLMGKVSGTPMAVWAIKGGVTAGSILLSERLWRSGHRGEAIGAMLASNALMAFVGARNTSVLRNQR